LKKLQWQGNERVIVFRCDDIGQTIMALPALRAIRDTLPDGHLALLTSHTAAGLMPCLEGVNEVIPFTTLWADKQRDLPFDPEREEGFIDELRSGKYDAAIFLTNPTQSSLPAAYACYMAGIPVRIGRSAEVAGSLLTHRVRGFGQGHEIDRCLEVVAAGGFTTSQVEPSLKGNEKLQTTVDQFLKNHRILGEPYAVVHAGGATGDGLTAAFARTMVELSRRSGYRALMTGLPNERLAIEWIAGEAGTPSVVIAGETTVADLALVIAGAELVVTANTSPAHIASAYGVPSVVLYDGATPPEQWLPRQRSVALPAGEQSPGDQLVSLLNVTEGRPTTVSAE
jgi:ADP-heptose:LPS heptosyltransferase